MKSHDVRKVIRPTKIDENQICKSATLLKAHSRAHGSGASFSAYSMCMVVDFVGEIGKERSQWVFKAIS